jgi:hypothetical protein
MAEPSAEAVDHLERTPTRRQLLTGTRAMLAVAAASALLAGWNVYRDATNPRRGARSRRSKWKWGALVLLWLGLAYWSERRQRSNSSS